MYRPAAQELRGSVKAQLLGIVARAWRRAAWIAALAMAPATSVCAATTSPATQVFTDATGKSAILFESGIPNQTEVPFFLSPAGGNGRTCATCHVASLGYSFTPAFAQATFAATNGQAPLFRVVDGASCSTDPVATVAQRQIAYAPLLNNGLIRVAQNAPAPALQMFSVLGFTDPYGCISNPLTGFSNFGPGAITTGPFSDYRRPLPTQNLGFLPTLMVDGRFADLTIQATQATIGHMQDPSAPDPAVMQAIVAFESGLFGAQSQDTAAGVLSTGGGNGGPVALQAQPFFAGINDAFGGDPTGAVFNPAAMTLFNGWAGSKTTQITGPARLAILAGQTIFNTRTFSITGVAGLNDTLGQPVITGTCSTCHDTPNVGSHSLPVFMNTGVTGVSPPGLNVSALPTYMLQCNAGPLAGQIAMVTDPGRALVTGDCADIGKTKVLALRNLAPRPPFFHNGSAPGLADVVNFYNQQFSIGLSVADQANLVAFLEAL